MKEFTISKEYHGLRIDRYCEKILPAASKSFLYKMFRKKNIVLNDGKIKGAERISQHDVVKFYLSDETFNKFSNVEKTTIHSRILKEFIIYEDDNVLIYNKPMDMLSQPNGKDENLYDGMLSYLKKKESLEENRLGSGPRSIGVCNRLDRNTTGVSIIGKNAEALRIINHSISNHCATKVYHAIVIGKVTKAMTINGFIRKDSNNNQVSIMDSRRRGDESEIHTQITPLKYNKSVNLSLVEVNLITGKTHQIRAHLSYINHPILGDYKYGNQEMNKLYKKSMGVNSQLLHAYQYTLTQLTGTLEGMNDKPFICEYPVIFNKMVERFF